MVVHFEQATTESDEHGQNDGKVNGKIFLFQTAPSKRIEFLGTEEHHRQNQ